jgi:RNA polymerase sigma factor (sigma-70 family)
MEDTELLRGYLNDHSEPAFAELVRRHFDLVYSAASRQVGGDPQTAEDIAQAVFTDLARNARRLAGHTSLTGWLYTATRYAAANWRRHELRRRTREQHAYSMNQILQSAESGPDWEELRPLLDDTMHELNPADRHALLLRYFDRRSLEEVGARLGLSGNAARMRLDRALDKLRLLLAKRGITSTGVALGTVLAGQAVGAAPAGLAARVSHAAFASVAAAGQAGGLLHPAWAPLKAKLLIGAGTAAVVLGFLFLPGQLNTGHPSALATNPLTMPQAASAPSASAGGGPAGAVDTASSDLAATSNQMVLEIVAADVDKPVPNVGIDYWLSTGTDSTHKTLQSSRFGRCVVPVPRDTATRLILAAQVDGFADTRLEWQPDRGETIPSEYRLRLARAAPIGGRVLDPEGRPVAGAHIGFNNRVNIAEETWPESRNFAWPFYVTAVTDSEGRWAIDRIAREAIRTLVGGASNPEYVRAQVSVAEDPQAEQQLLAGTYVFRLGRAVTVRGVVVDPDGAPVPNARVLVGGLAEVNSRQATSRADGGFTIPGCKPGEGLISAELDGFTAVSQTIEVETNAGPVRLTLERGKVLRLAVVDQRGLPVPRATVWLNAFVPGPTGPPTAPQTHFERQTDSDGRLEWGSAPDRELVFGVFAPGYMRMRGVSVRPDGEEHTITLPPALTISGTVRDAATGQLLPHFRIITGWPVRNDSNVIVGQRWSPIDRFWLRFQGGKFRYVYEEPAVAGPPKPEFAFRFEAEGYAPFIAGPVQADAGEARFEVALRAAAPTTVTVLNPDGSAAVGADVGLAAPGSPLALVPGGFAPRNRQPGVSLLSADDQGRFRLPPDDSISRVVAANSAGYSEATPAELASRPTLQLQPWGRIEGTLVRDGGPAPNVQLVFRPGPNEGSGVTSVAAAFGVRTDATGQFVFRQVPPGPDRIVTLTLTTSSNGVTLTELPVATPEVRPGQTTRLALVLPATGPNAPQP